MVSEIQPGQTFSRRTPAHPDTMGENNTPTALKGCGVTMHTQVENMVKIRGETKNFVERMKETRKLKL